MTDCPCSKLQFGRRNARNGPKAQHWRLGTPRTVSGNVRTLRRLSQMRGEKMSQTLSTELMILVVRAGAEVKVRRRRSFAHHWRSPDDESGSTSEGWTENVTPEHKNLLLHPGHADGWLWLITHGWELLSWSNIVMQSLLLLINCGVDCKLRHFFGIQRSVCRLDPSALWWSQTWFLQVVTGIGL